MNLHTKTVRQKNALANVNNNKVTRSRIRSVYIAGYWWPWQILRPRHSNTQMIPNSQVIPTL